MPPAKFEFLYSNLDIGQTEKVVSDNDPQKQVLDLKKKLSPIISHFNERNLELKSPDFSKPLSIDESLRGSYSRGLQMKQYMPLKPEKYAKNQEETKNNQGNSLIFPYKAF